jgi:hypothetical protein
MRPDFWNSIAFFGRAEGFAPLLFGQEQNVGLDEDE